MDPINNILIYYIKIIGTRVLDRIPTALGRKMTYIRYNVNHKRVQRSIPLSINKTRVCIILISIPRGIITAMCAPRINDIVTST